MLSLLGAKHNIMYMQLWKSYYRLHILTNKGNLSLYFKEQIKKP
jgi:hypothetical protein